MSVPVPKIRRYVKLRQEGWNRSAACREVGVSRDWAIKFEKDHENNGDGYRAARTLAEVPQPIALDALGDEAKRGLEDFEFFRRFFFGHVSTPWQVETAVRIVEKLASPDKEYLIINCPPGVGKTTLLHDVACWVTVRDRRVRGLIGSRVSNNARRMLLRVRRSLERVQPARAKSEDIERGLALDAQGTLAAHYGLFKPASDGDVWRAEEFIVAQFDDLPVEEKEPTWSSYGRDSGVLSNRFDIIFWDDLVDRTNCRSAEAITELEQHWDTELETRLEPSGLTAIVGQLLSSRDLYHHCAAKSMAPEDEDEEGDEAQREPMYERIVYQAHDEARCEKVHRKTEAKPWPDGCLLDPRRLAWPELRRIKDTKSHVYEVSYQQRDVDPDEVLVPELWVKGGVDPETGEYLPGCWDPKRRVGEIPKGLSGSVLSIASADPSPTKFWSIQWWLYHPETEQRFLLDLERRAMEAPDFLDRMFPSGEFTGLMEDWQRRSVEVGAPITTWIVERNAAQRFMLQYDHVKKWQALRQVSIIGHDTYGNKSDPDMGITSMKPHWRHGRVRLPGDIYDGRLASLKLVEEVTKYPNGHRSDDCVMAEWFFEWNLPKFTVADLTKMPKLGGPSWMRPEDERVPA